MKFDTNKTKASSCTKISAGQIYLMDNRSIPANAPGWEVPSAYDADCEDCDDDNVNMNGGRQVMYEPTVVFTPVYASLRQHQQEHHPNQGSADGRSLLSWPGVKEVLSKLEALSLGNDNDSEGDNHNNTIKAPARMIPSKEARDEAATGRYHLRGNKASTLAPEAVVSSATTTTTTTRLAMAGAAAADHQYQNVVRRSPRLHPELATSPAGAEPCRPAGYATRRSSPFGY